MSFVVSSGQLAVTGAGVAQAYMPPMLPAAPWEYETIWRTQPQVRTVVGFLARNVAQLGIQVFRRVSDTDRERLTDHPFAQLLAAPLPRLTQYRFVERLVSDVAIYDNAYAIKLKLNGAMQLLPVPPTLIRPYGGNWIAPDHYETAGGRQFGPDEVVHLHGYNPQSLTYGSSAIEALRDLLLESSQAAAQRSEMWRNGARMTGVLQRPSDAPDWDATERNRFREMWRAFTAGGGSEGGTPILEDGMVYAPIGMNPEQAQYIEARKLTREECAAAYFIPPPLIGILDNATYSNIQEQHKHLYQDTLGPWLVMAEQDFDAQILPDLPDSDGVYCEFNIQAKLRGSFEEQAAAASTATGGPWMTRNEIRARNNLPSIAGGDELIVPMNVTEGGLASPRDTAPDGSAAASPKGRGLVLVKSGRPSDLGEQPAEQDALVSAVQGWTQRAADAFVKAVGDAAGMPDLLALWATGADDRIAQLHALLGDHGYRLAQVGAWEVLERYNPDDSGWAADVMLAWIIAAAETHAVEHESAGRSAVSGVEQQGGDDWRDNLGAAASNWVSLATVRALTAGTEARSFGSHDAASASGLGKKTWRTGSNPRADHARMDGESVALDAKFSNGLRWPGDGEGDIDEVAGCNCRLDYGYGTGE